MVFIISLRLKNNFERWMDKYLERNRGFSIAKKEIQYKNDDTKKKVVTSKTITRKIKVLRMGLLTTSLQHRSVYFKDEDQQRRSGKKHKKRNRITLSFFQAPAWYIEHLRRNRTNSFKEFLSNIYESAAHFPKWKLNSESAWRSTSVRLDLLKNRYLEFCTKEGYKPREIQDETSVMKQFNLKLDYKIDTTTDAYTYIRWKTPLEKQEDAQAIKLGTKEHKEEELTVIAQFLVAECSRSVFKDDFILMEDMKDRYNQFCKEKNIDELAKMNIVGAYELESFGAKLDLNLYIPYMSGIAFMNLPGLKKMNYLPGIIRIPKETKARKNEVGMHTKYTSKVTRYLFSYEGILTNFMVVFVHWLLLTSIPFLITIAVVWSLLQIQVINEDIHAITYSLDHVFNPSYYEFWLDHLPGNQVLYGFIILWIVFWV